MCWVWIKAQNNRLLSKEDWWKESCVIVKMFISTAEKPFL